MGQCSTLPTEARNEVSTSSNYNPAKDKDSHMTTASSDNSQTPLTAHHRQTSKRPNGYQLQVETEKNKEEVEQRSSKQIKPKKNSSVVPFRPEQTPQNNQERPTTGTSLQPMQEDNTVLAPPPPDSAVRTRCYKLNLESEYVGINAASIPRYDGQVFGPFLDAPPPLTYSGSDDSVGSVNATNVAIKTAQIFRGITVSKDGTILSQNARATRSNRTNKVKRGEKSRQAAKIDKANDLVEESIATGKTADDKDAQMLSLVIIGEYDELKQLVRDGSKKLRDANGLPDQTLFAVNRPRVHNPMRTQMLSSPSRKRGSPFALGSSHSNGNAISPHSKARHSVPPKIKSHPRDPSIREDNRQGGRRGFNPMDHPCNNLLNSHGESDWGPLGFSRGFNSIWNCGGNGGTISPTQHVQGNKGYATSNPVAPQPTKPVIEQRHETNYRAVRTSERMEPPAGHQRQALHA
mmetsp:Transcript_660/g.1043  ORF Transcript_660/g.1043 Transcript_660/m.1043 type:complete len:462 (+) Transcript_660:436-1821(+)|eukprot:CAMPEP_0194202284 /NCGR_PEP_ID=MMETSP0156-20130528/2352_1 /TAXON_ID=33649 /ORGANISM="Thalassionema nitzschioides, Strain L26-B" /LENGTH=461 /DNA_ID=CAMNT_0038927741 /DNA_START=336 /DNA_END=1721 /DNA_ORIENTATION=-